MTKEDVDCYYVEQELIGIQKRDSVELPPIYPVNKLAS